MDSSIRFFNPNPQGKQLYQLEHSDMYSSFLLWCYGFCSFPKLLQSVPFPPIPFSEICTFVIQLVACHILYSILASSVLLSNFFLICIQFTVTQNSFNILQEPLHFTYSPSPSKLLATIDSCVFQLYSFAFSECQIIESWSRQVFQTGFFHQQCALKTHPCLSVS